jgi:hypothetical protein
MVRSLAALLLLCLSAQPVFAFNIDWQGRVERFSRYVDKHSLAQGQRRRILEMQSQGFNTRAPVYVRALEARARPFQAKPASSAAQN